MTTLAAKHQRPVEGRLSTLILRLMREAGRPMFTQEVIAAVQATGERKSSERTIARQLAYLREGHYVWSTSVVDDRGKHSLWHLYADDERAKLIREDEEDEIVASRGAPWIHPIRARALGLRR